MAALDVRSRLAAEVSGLLRYARTIAADGELAEDLVQETLLRALQRADSFRAEASLATWLHRILHNLAVDLFRRDREDATEDVEREVEERWRDDAYTVDAAIVVERAETREELEDALVRLPVIYRTAVVLHDSEGMTVAEIADVQGVGLPAAKARLRRGRMMMVDALAQGRALPWVPCVTPTPSSRCRWPTASRSCSPSSEPHHCMPRLRVHGNCHTGCSSVRLQVHCCVGWTLAMTASTCMPQPVQVVFPQRVQRAGLHIMVPPHG